VIWEAPLTLYYFGRKAKKFNKSQEETIAMLLEIQIAVSFLTSYLYNKLPRRRVDLFSVELAKQLKEKFEGHWYPQRPSKGSGYRCLLIGEKLDPVLMNAANDSGLSLEEIRSSLPEKLNMWIDPDEVSYRIGKFVVKLLVCSLHLVPFDLSFVLCRPEI
jgi:protein Tob/BTG